MKNLKASQIRKDVVIQRSWVEKPQSFFGTKTHHPEAAENGDQIEDAFSQAFGKNVLCSTHFI